MPTTSVRGSRRARPHLRRYLTVAQVNAGRGGGVGRGALDETTVLEGVERGYAARGPWEVERRGGSATLLHYSFPVAKAIESGNGSWILTKAQGRPGYGLSTTDIRGISEFGRVLKATDMPEMKVGLNPDSRLRPLKFGGERPSHMGSRVSPYARVQEEGMGYTDSRGHIIYPYGPGERFKARRGRRA